MFRRFFLLMLLGTSVSCATVGPDAKHVANATRAERSGDLAKASEELAAAGVACQENVDSAECRKLFIRAGDLELRRDKTWSAAADYQRALKQPPHTADGDAELSERLFRANAAIEDRLRRARQEPPCRIRIIFDALQDPLLELEKGGVTVDGAAPAFAPPSPGQAPTAELELLAVPHDLALALKFAGRQALSGYRVTVTSRYTFECHANRTMAIRVIVYRKPSSFLETASEKALDLDVRYDAHESE